MITALFAAAYAQEPDIEIDLGGSEQTPISYDGSYTTRAATKVAVNALLKITASVGTTTVYCTDTDGVDATITYRLSGLDGPALEAYGKTLKLAVSGTAVSFVSGTKPASLKNANVSLVVNVPKESRLTISANGDWVKVVGCAGTVAATTKTSAYVGGPLDGFNVTANGGNAVVEVEGDGKLTNASAISAPKGDATLTMPFAQDLKIDARGSAVTVAQGVTGTNESAVVSGVIGAGGPTLTIKASGTVTVKTP